ncbi:MAG: FapA family protein [Firmicutes bacterium]|nr:FapA family protein [Bacillota bacterium]
MRGKYFSGLDAESCYVAAEEYFSTSRENLYCRLAPSENDGSSVLLAIDAGPAGPASLENMKAFFNLVYTDEGVLLELFKHHGHGKKLSQDELALYLKRKSLSDLNNTKLPILLSKGWGFANIAPPQQELVLNEEALVSVDAAEDKAFITIWPADKDGKKLAIADLHAALAEAGVVHGIDEAALQKLYQEKKPYKNYTVAHATKSQHGKNGHLTFHFRREFESRPKEDEHGRVNYRELDLFEGVAAGQLLVTLTPPTEGILGYSVKGKEMSAAAGKNVIMPKGKNTYIDEENLHMYSAVSGMVVYAEGKIIVSNVYQIDGDVDMSVGNIDFDGSVVVKGHVITGLTVKASGNIDIGMVVEGATIIAGGNITLRHGMQGMNRGRLEAGGSISAGFIERATIIAGENVKANIIAFSTVEAGNSLVLSGKKGSLLGGQAVVSNMLKANIIGSPTETPTEVVMGLVPHKRSRMQELQQKLKTLPEEIEKLNTIKNYLLANPSEDAKKKAMALSVNQSLAHNTQLLEDISEEFAELSEESANAINGKVHITEAVYPGARLTIASATYRVMEKTPHCTFKMANGEIAFGAYEG